MKTAFNYKKGTGKITSTVSVSKDSDLILNKENGCKLFIVSNSHRALGKEHEYEIKGGKIKRKPQTIIDKDIKDKKDADIQRSIPAYLKDDPEIINEILTEHINALNKNAGLPDIKLKAMLKKRRQQYKNPNKK